jgi:RND family efflux transporter MFP subunit
MKYSWWLAAAVVLSSCGRDETRRVEAAPAAPVAVQVATVSLEERPVVFTATGTVRPAAAVTISAKVMGYVQQVHVRAGDAVREGQLLVTLDSRDLDSNVRRADAGRKEAESAMGEVDHAIAGAKANLDLAQATLRRIQELAAKKSASNQELDEATARFQSAQSAHQMALARRVQVEARIAQAGEEQRAAHVVREYAELKAPFAGVVTEKLAEPGTMASPGTPLLVLERAGGYRLEAAVEESRSSSVRMGQAVRVSLEGAETDGRVVEIMPSVDAASRSYTVKVALAGPVRSGMFGKAEFPSGTRKLPAVPAAAVIERGQMQSVVTVENGTAHVRLITAGTRGAGWVEVLSGLSAGEKVVTPAPAAVADGARVEVRP